MQSNANIDNGRPFDWGRASEDYARYRDIYPPEFFKAVVDMGLCVAGQRVLDLGTGTGVLPRGLYSTGAEFVGTDISPQQIAQARALSQQEGMEISYLVCAAEEIDFPAHSFDVVTACQCFFYFDLDRLLPNIRHILRPNGHLCTLFMAWLPAESSIAQASEQMVLRYNPHWTGKSIQRSAPTAPPWSLAHFRLQQTAAFDVLLPFTRESWHGRIRACRGIGASALSPKEIERWEEEHRAYLATQPPTFHIPHYITVLDFQLK